MEDYVWKSCIDEPIVHELGNTNAVSKVRLCDAAGGTVDVVIITNWLFAREPSTLAMRYH